MKTLEPIKNASASRIKAAVTRFENAVEDRAFKGAAHPDDRPVIERRYLLAKANLFRYLGFTATVDE